MDKHTADVLYTDFLAGLDVDSASGTVDLLTDVDGPLNFDASRSAYRKHKDALGYLRRGSTLTADDNYSHFHDFNWSGELISKLNDVHSTHNVNWLYHSTWWNDAGRLNFMFGAHADGGIPWDHMTDVTRSNHSELRAARKYAALKGFVAKTKRPFIWTDDDATVLYNPADFTVPHLVLPVTLEFGLLKPDLALILDFIHTHATTK